MVLDRRRRFGFLAAAIICFVIAALAFAGVILVGDWVGRVIFGVVWVALGIVWLGSYFGAFFARPKRSAPQQQRDLTSISSRLGHSEATLDSKWNAAPGTSSAKR